MLKRILKWVIVIFASLLAIIIAFFLFLKYEMSWKLSYVGEEISPDGQYRLLFQQIGEPDFPFGYSHAKITLYDGEKKVDSFNEDIADDGGQFRMANYSVEWMKKGVVVTFKGSEQADREVAVFFDGADSFEGYTDEEIREILEERYGIKQIEYLQKTIGGYKIKANGIAFYAKDDLAFHESYQQEYFKALTEEVFPGMTGRGISWETENGESPAEITYIPMISMHSSGKQDIDAYCSDICKWLSHCMEKIPYDDAPKLYRCIVAEVPGYENSRYYFDEIYLKNFKESDKELYNSLYIYLNNMIDSKSSGQNDIEGEDSNESTEAVFKEISNETVKTWAQYEPEAVYDFSDGTEYAMIAVDRALGSSFYVLMSYKEKGNPDTAELVNSDPFNNQCGAAHFISFIDDSDVGFACLSYNGGTEGSLFMTKDRGKEYEELTLPSPNIELPDGKFYNPFVMPEKAWEEGGKIYLKVGQGSEGDYYNEELGGHPYGIYASDDNGESFYFVKEEL